MREIGIRELKERASEVLREVRESREPISITLRGKIIAHIVPADDKQSALERDLAIWAEMDRLAEEISAHWPPGVSAVDAVREQRRDL